MTADPHMWPEPTRDSLLACLAVTREDDQDDRFARLLPKGDA